MGKQRLRGTVFTLASGLRSGPRQEGMQTVATEGGTWAVLWGPSYLSILKDSFPPGREPQPLAQQRSPGAWVVEEDPVSWRSGQLEHTSPQPCPSPRGTWPASISLADWSVCVCGAEPWASPAVGRGEKAPAGVGCDSQQGWTQTKGVSPGA